MFHHTSVMLLVAALTAVHYPANSASTEMGFTTEETTTNKTDSDESGYEPEGDEDVLKEKKLLDDAMKTILDPNTTIAKSKDLVEMFKIQLEELSQDNITIEQFIDGMDNLSMEACKASQDALWSYVDDFINDSKKNKMIKFAMAEEEVKKLYWENIKKKYLESDKYGRDPVLLRKLRIIKLRGINIQLPPSKQREDIDLMQKIWSRVLVCAYNTTNCYTEDSVRTISAIMSIFKTSHNSKELIYYWKAFHDETGKKIRPVYKKFVETMNSVAQSENFPDAGAMWRYAFEDENFVETVGRLWKDIKPLYHQLCGYVRGKLKTYYYSSTNDFNNDDDFIPAHLLGNLWAQEWQSIYSMVTAYPQYGQPKLIANENTQPKDLLDTVDEFYQSIGFESASDAYKDLKKSGNGNCLPSSYNMCDGINYKIKWCDQKVTDLNLGLSHAARLLGRVQYFKHYKNLSPLFQDGPNSAFNDAISDVMSLQVTSPAYLETLAFAKTDSGPEVTMNHLLWVALEKLPLIAYAYVLDKWRWDIFENTNLENWNEHFWNLRMTETGISPPIPRNESDLDPAAKYHVVSHMPYITYFISTVLEFQILLSLCKKTNHTGPLHKCSLYGVKEAGKLLSDGMSLGASEDWRTVLETITGDRELSSKGILEYFAPLEDFLKQENLKVTKTSKEVVDQTAPIIVGTIVVLLTIIIVVIYCAKKHDLRDKVLTFCGLGKNGSMDIETNDNPTGKTNETEEVCEDKV